MSIDDQEDTTIYAVVVNHEEQYSIWAADRELPLGWRLEGKRGTKADCLAHIETVWTDMRPLSLRKQMEAAAAAPAEDDVADEPPEDDLVQRLAAGSHPIEVTLRPDRTAAALKECIERGYVHIKFTDTDGGTELGVRLDPAASDLAHADFAAPRGSVRLVGSLTLNFEKVRCVAEVDLSSLNGQGRLERLDGAASA
jgi:uncharacterized protein YbdZ (MbtH family)